MLALRLLRRPSTPSTHRLAAGLVAAVLAIAAVGTVGVAPAAAADSLKLAVTTTYRVDAAKGAVHVTMDVTSTNLKPSTATRFYYYDSLSFGVQPEARSVQATSGDRRLTVTTKAHDRFRDVVVRTPRLLYHQTQTTHITFDLPGGKPRSASPVRVGRAYAAFTVWAWGDPGLADVRIVLPPRFSGDVRALPADTRDQLTSTSKDGRLTYAADDIADPESWYATVDIADHDALTDVSLDLGGEDVVIHAWPEDREWLDRVSSVVEASVPDLETAIGLPWPVDRELGISEVSSTQIEGYAGLYDSATDEIQISEDLDEQIIVHETAHAWFNGGLFAQRWISEGLADEYASRVIAAEGRTVAGPDTVSSHDKAAFRLNDWPPPSRVDATTRASETYGYDASWTVIRSIVDDVGEAKMHDVFAAAAAGTVAYVGSGPAETSAPAVADWRRFLDLVEDVGGSTKAAGLIETWAVTGVQRPQLAARATARQRYDALVAAGSGWLPGIVVREPMSEWQFDTAKVAMTAAETVLADRDRLNAETTELGLAFPAALEPAYESAASASDLTTLDGRIATWIKAADAVRSARDALAADRGPLVRVGLLGARPEAAYSAALAAFAAGDDSGAVEGSSATVAALSGAEEIGRGRTLAVGAGVVGVVLLLLLVVWLLLRIRRRRHARLEPAASMVGPVFPSDPDELTSRLAPSDPYATLAATPDPLEGDEIGVEPD